MNQIKTGVKGGALIVDSFVGSAEFRNRNLSNDEAVKTLYRTMLSREADEGGLAHWKGYLEDGASLHRIVYGFAGAQEFRNLCDSYGISAGTITLTEYRDKNINVTRFVNRNYLYALNRKGEPDGLNHWCEQIIRKKITPQQCAQKFVFSQECVNRKLSNEAFVEMLYHLYMGRNPDQGGKEHWIQELKKVSRQNVADRFANSQEFKQIVASYGL